ncbi:hypothetical protein SMB34_18520 [Thalassospira permensis NBRC 106175]|uniref:Uncharacterized protein n=1 Tax=Thalassospira permensis NBRC 106175 TaxID=1353532 RepID=A0ABR4TMZ2_9PROT|nr:hypothetical protein SMB34_18520 [Thalassospira permensis NBRC 106175]
MCKLPVTARCFGAVLVPAFRGKSDFTTARYIYVFAKDGWGGMKGCGCPFCAVQNGGAVVPRVKRLFSAVGVIGEMQFLTIWSK